MVPNSGTTTLKHGSVGFWRVVFQGVSASAPAGAIVTFITAASVYAGGSLPLSFLIAFFAVLSVSVPIYQYSKKISHAGGYYAFVSRSAGPFAGIMTGMLVLGYHFLVLGFLPLFFSIILSFTFQYFFGITLPVYFWAIVVVLYILITAIPPYLGIKPSLNYSFIFGWAEIIVIAIVAIIIAILSGSHNSAAVFSTKYSPTGFHGALLGGIFGISAFLGFSSIVRLGEEAEFPKKVIGKALITDVLISGTFLVGTAYAFDIGWGPANAISMSNYLVPLTVETNSFLGLFAAVIVTIFFIESYYNVGLSFFTSTIRYFYGMARDDHIIPVYFAKIHDESGVPRRALILIVIIGLAFALIFGAVFGPLEGYILEATGLTILALTALIIVALTVGFLFKRENEFNIVWHLVIPVISAGLMAFVIYATVYPPSYPLTYMAIGAVVWAAISAALTLYVRKYKPDKYKDAGKYSSVED